MSEDLIMFDGLRNAACHAISSSTFDSRRYGIDFMFRETLHYLQQHAEEDVISGSSIVPDVVVVIRKNELFDTDDPYDPRFKMPPLRVFDSAEPLLSVFQ